MGRKKDHIAQEAPQETPAAPTKEEKERAELIDHLQRLQAEFDNYRRRMEAQLAAARDQAADNLLRDLLPIQESLTLSIEHNQQGEELIKGLLIIKDQLANLLADQGVQEIPAAGKFDPNLHEALMTTQEGTPGEIHLVLQKGFTRHGRILRPARVSVTR